MRFRAPPRLVSGNQMMSTALSGNSLHAAVCGINLSENKRLFFIFFLNSSSPSSCPFPLLSHPSSRSSWPPIPSFIPFLSAVGVLQFFSFLLLLCFDSHFLVFGFIFHTELILTGFSWFFLHRSCGWDEFGVYWERNPGSHAL